jgi:hypothetical protein
MSSKDEIKSLFVAELKNTPEYKIVMAIKTVIVNEISVPNVQSQIIYNFEYLQSDYSIEVIKMCMQIEFGFKVDNISGSCVVIDMGKFLD